MTGNTVDAMPTGSYNGGVLAKANKNFLRPIPCR
jgi:hypothetical protein